MSANTLRVLFAVVALALINSVALAASPDHAKSDRGPSRTYTKA